MSWITITTAAVQSRLADAELDAARTAAVAEGQADPLTEVIERVISEVRGRVAANSANVLGESGTIPDECEDAALALITFRLYSRLPVTIPDARKEAKSDALTFLAAVAAGQVAIIPPSTAAAVQATSVHPGIRARPRRFSREQQDGI